MLKRFVPNFMVDTVYDIDMEFLKKNNIKGIIYDVDNTLVGFKIKVPDEKLMKHLFSLREQGIKLFIISNNNKERVEKFNEKLDISYISRGMKPLKFAFKKAAKLMGLKPQEIAVVGDQIFTDVWGSNRVSMISVMVSPIDLKETFLFKIKRKMERPFIARYQKENER